LSSSLCLEDSNLIVSLCRNQETDVDLCLYSSTTHVSRYLEYACVGHIASHAPLPKFTPVRAQQQIHHVCHHAFPGPHHFVRHLAVTLLMIFGTILDRNESLFLLQQLYTIGMMNIKLGGGAFRPPCSMNFGDLNATSQTKSQVGGRWGFPPPWLHVFRRNEAESTLQWPTKIHYCGPLIPIPPPMPDRVSKADLDLWRTSREVLLQKCATTRAITDLVNVRLLFQRWSIDENMSVPSEFPTRPSIE
ncbi:unnamed protein product, partial [Ectocarpus sp. 4 AP-2014]